MVRAGRIARGRTDPAVFFTDQILVAQSLGLAEAPQIPHLLVHALGEGFGQPVGQGLQQNRIVIVVRGLERLGPRLDPEAGRHGETAAIIDPSALLRRDEIGQRVIRLPR